MSPVKACALVSVALGLVSGCHGRASAGQCRAIAERYVELAARETPGGASLSPAQAAAVRDVERGLKRAVPSFRRVQDHCEGVTKAEASCAAGAAATRDWEACFDEADR